MDTFKILSAPLQGYTTRAWRLAHWRVFGAVDDYTAPFMRVQRGQVRRHDVADVDPSENADVPLVPQILASQPGDALIMVNALTAMGYHRIDINLGCPFPPIALHRKGSGMLPHPDLVEELFTSLATVQGVEYSLKMRLGWDHPEQWKQVLPLTHILRPVRVVVHPRIGKQQYAGDLDMAQFEQLLANCPWPVVFNGGITSPEQIDEVRNNYPSLAGVMVGRGLISNPAMLCPEKATPACYRQFHDNILNDYTTHMTGGDKQVLTHMKALWEWMLPQADKRARKAIKKSTRFDHYLAAVDQVFAHF